MGRAVAKQEPEELDAARITDLVAKYLALEGGPFRSSLKIAIERLRLAPTHGWYHERAMDLGIALEATLWAGDTGTYQGELAHRFMVRGTFLKGGNRDLRRSTAKDLKAFYGIRSRVAHGGESPHGDEQKQAVIDRCLELCFDLITELIERGEPPDWDGLVMGW
jgi:hypothetical protein